MTGTEYDYNNLPQMPRKPIVSGLVAALIVVAIFIITCNA